MSRPLSAPVAVTIAAAFAAVAIVSAGSTIVFAVVVGGVGAIAVAKDAGVVAVAGLVERKKEEGRKGKERKKR
jgi:hypothetical protein